MNALDAENERGGARERAQQRTTNHRADRDGGRTERQDRIPQKIHLAGALRRRLRRVITQRGDLCTRARRIGVYPDVDVRATCPGGEPALEILPGASARLRRARPIASFMDNSPTNAPSK